MTGASLYRWPDAAKFGRVVPKTKFYEHGNVSAALRQRFINDVQRVTWAYKLADATIHLRGDADVPEIQVFIIEAKETDVGEDVLAAIDKAVRFPIIFEINTDLAEPARTRMAATYKLLGGTTPRLGAYFSSAWQDADAERAPLPPALDLSGLYTSLLIPLLPIAPRPDERVGDAIVRMDQARKLEREVASLERRLRVELQLNRKVELRRKLRDRVATLATLTDLLSPKVEDGLGNETSWKS